ncbi:Golgi apyrase [Coniosporium tulheliwenetii]|uniref:Golgi apyrase n=1 Tax=Coniosporium tulheliwenetii TaxID=3383036 RepID=A0ACC2ZAH7_9PEZI|nr:Golgi apyrase [Cladosporium sp. JES 115]
MGLSIIVRTIILALASFTVATGSSGPIVDLGYAQHEGIRDNTLGITGYCGLHYAAAPTGRLRWQPPVNIEKRNNYSKHQVLNATAPGPQCLQQFPAWTISGPLTALAPAGNSASSKDYLLLDVIVPSVSKNVSLPVIVQIHGGGYIQGNSTSYPGNFLVAQSQGGLIYVQIQYRLGALGFLSGSEIRKHEYPWWQPYHNDTILESQYRDLLSASNCTSLRCLRQLPYNTLATAIQSTYILGYQAGLYGHGDFYYGPSVDGSIILDLPSNEFERGHFSRIPLLTDRETYEGAFFSNFSLTDATEIDPDLQRVWPAAQPSFFTRLNELYPLSAFTGSYLGGPFITALASFIPTLTNNSAFWKRVAIFSDFIINCPTYYMGSALSHAGVPVWKMVFNAGSQTHASTAPYLLGPPGNVTSFIENQFIASNATLAAIMRDYFLSFATELDPNTASFSGVDRPYWPQYDTPADAAEFTVLEFPMGKWRYGVILDAGSSGTRVHIYRWLNSAKARKEASEQQLSSLPVLETKKQWTHKIHPGVSTFGEKPDRIGPDHLAELFEHALKYIPKHEVENTAVFLLATAGMRLLPDIQRKMLLAEICSYAQTHTAFQLPDCGIHIQVIPGETEGLYGWIAANYLLGGFDAANASDHGNGHHTYGFLDMGGASAQIAFAPNATEAEKHANDLTLLRLRTIGGDNLEYKVFSTTWLGYGVNEARKRFVKALVEASPDATELPDPCLPAGLNVTTAGKPIEPGSPAAKGDEPHLLGTGRFSECISQTYPLLDKDAPCLDDPCLFHGSHVPAIDFDVNHFVGVSEYWHTTHEIFELAHVDKAYDFHTYQERVQEFCSQPYQKILDGVNSKKWGKKVDEETAIEVCFKASWLINMLHEGIGVPRVGLEHMKGGHNGTKAVIENAKAKGYLDPFQAINKINGTEVSWTLGKMVLYASSQIPPADNALAVGFGSNEPGIPDDFQFAGGKDTLLADDLTGESNDDWHDILSHSSNRRIPGFLLLILIFAVILFLVCGRERRHSLFSKLRSFLGFPGKLFGSTVPMYERVLEEGDPASSFELADVDSDNDTSDSADGSRVGRTSGWATPQLKLGNLADGGSGYFGNVVEQGQGLGLGPPSVVFGNAMERAGLMSRTDSKERLALSAAPGHRSRTGSPNRFRMPLKANVD